LSAERTENFLGKKTILWVSPLIVDLNFHKTSRIEVLRALQNRGHKTYLLASYSSKKNLTEFSGINPLLIPMRYVPLFSAFLYVLLLFFYLPFLVAYLKPDFVVMEPHFTALSLTPIFFFPKSIKPKIILDIRSTPVGMDSHRYFNELSFSLALRTAKRFFQGITIVTELMKEEVCKRFNINPKSVGVWTSGVSTELFKPGRKGCNEFRENLGISGKFVVFYHGIFDEKRGLMETVQAMKCLETLHPDIVLFLMGQSGAEDRFSMEDFVKKSDSKNVIIHERVSYLKVPAYIDMCDVGIVPLPNVKEWRYQCPLNLLEYLSMGKVTIATDIPANREILDSSKCVIYTSSTEPMEIARAIVAAYNAQSKLREWGADGQEIVAKKYTWTKIGENLENYLLSL
jgi:glycosyltransferase involved in cell wall biosynthesis